MFWGCGRLAIKRIEQTRHAALLILSVADFPWRFITRLETEKDVHSDFIWSDSTEEQPGCGRLGEVR